LSKLDPTQTIITLRDDIPWRAGPLAPEQRAEAVMAGSEDGEGAYLVLMKWYPGWMSAPHTYVTDRLCVVISGMWWCNSGPDFDRGQAVPVSPGGFVRRVAGTPHYDGARAGAAEPAVVAVSGMAPSASSWWTLHNRCFANGQKSRIGLRCDNRKTNILSARTFRRQRPDQRR
jgi:hypothetical protein